MGGVERETFYEAQRRNRRASWRFTVLSGIAVLVVGFPLSVLVSPVLAAAAIMTNDVVNLVVPTPDAVAELEDLSERWSDAVDAQKRGEPADFPIAQAVTIGVLLLMPGIVAMFLAWLLVRRIFMRSATGAVVLAAGARPPHPGAIEERQLVNLVEEMALAAGVLPPRVMVVDDDILNAAVVGRSLDDVTIVVPRRLLEELGRDQTSAVIADLLATVVNGDLRAALVVASVFQTFDLVGALVAAPLSKRNRRVLWRLLRLALRRRSTAAASDGREEHYIAEEIADLAALGGLDDDPEPSSGCLTFPFLAASVAYTLTQGLVGLFFVTPVMAGYWRRRRLLADATAVQLTRNPDALIRALEHMESREAGVPPGPWTHLFVVGPEVRAGMAKRRLDQRMRELQDDRPQAGEGTMTAVRRKMRESSAANRDYQQALEGARGDLGSPSLMRSGLDRFIPPLDKRLRRLEAMGGQPTRRPEAPVRPRRRPKTLGGWLLWPLALAAGLVLLALMVACGLMILFLLAGLIYIALLLELLVVTIPVLLVNLWLR